MRFRKPAAHDTSRPASKDKPQPGSGAPDVARAIGNQAVARELGGAETGAPLPAATRAKMSSLLGRSFEDVRIHIGDEGSRVAQDADARAVTMGSHIAFNQSEFNPGTPAGDALIAHELTHVVQQENASRDGDARVQPESGALESDASRATAGMLAKLWGGAKSIAGAVGPTMRSGLSVQRCGKKKPPAAKAPAAAPAKADSKADSAQKPKAAADPLASAKASLATEFGFSSVTEKGGAAWTAPELAKAKKILAKLPTEAKAAIQGVALIRVKTPNCPGGDPAGCFTSSINATTGNREDAIEMGDQAFSEDKDFEEAGKGNGLKSASRKDMSGATITSLPSQDVLLHEVGHALDSAERRKAEAGSFRADLEVGKAHKKFEDAVKIMNRVQPGAFSIQFSANAKEVKYQKSVITVADRFQPLFDAIGTVGGSSTAKEIGTAEKAAKPAFEAAKKAIAARDKAKAELPAGSSVVETTVESGQDAALKAAQDVIDAMAKRGETQKALEAANAAEAATKKKFAAGTGSVEGSKRLGEIVALVAIKKIDIKMSGLRKYVKDNWPKDPDELYADLFQMSITEAPGLEVFDKDIAAYFRSPLGIKDKKLQGKVDDWLKKNKGK